VTGRGGGSKGTAARPAAKGSVSPADVLVISAPSTSVRAPTSVGELGWCAVRKDARLFIVWPDPTKHS
jgi:hypothetical protein